MEFPSVFAFKDYRLFIKATIDRRDESWGIITRMARAAGCQRPYLSKVLKGEAQLTPAQAFGLTRFWKLGAAETGYFLQLLEEERAGSLEYRQYVQRRASASRIAQEDLARKVSREAGTPSIDPRDVEYYSAWYWTAIHVLVSIPSFQTLEAICRKLSLAPTLVEAVLKRLEARGFVRREGSRWRFASNEHHVPKTSPLVAFHHANWRQRATLDAQDPRSDGIHYTVVQSLSRADYEQLRQLVLDFIERSARIAGPSSEEELMCITCDLFRP